MSFMSLAFQPFVFGDVLLFWIIQTSHHPKPHLKAFRRRFQLYGFHQNGGGVQCRDAIALHGSWSALNPETGRQLASSCFLALMVLRKPCVCFLVLKKICSYIEQFVLLVWCFVWLLSGPPWVVYDFCSFVFGCFWGQLMVNCWFGLVVLGFWGYTQVTISFIFGYSRNPNYHRAPNQQLTIS